MNKSWPLLRTCNIWHGQSKTFKISLPVGQTLGDINIISAVKYGQTKIIPQITYLENKRICEIYYSVDQLVATPINSVAILDIIFQDAKNSMPYLIETCHIKEGASYF
jgi:hypothetical protein